jgi:NADPH-dependent 7-cyano-7-deazaguanine reductase QueF
MINYKEESERLLLEVESLKHTLESIRRSYSDKDAIVQKILNDITIALGQAQVYATLANAPVELEPVVSSWY